MEMEMEAPGFWDDPDRSNQKMKELKNMKDTVGECNGLFTQYEDILTLIEMGYEENDESMVANWRTSRQNLMSFGFLRCFPESTIKTMQF